MGGGGGSSWYHAIYAGPQGRVSAELPRYFPRTEDVQPPTSLAPVQWIADLVEASGGAFSWTEPVTSPGGQYRLCWSLLFPRKQPILRQKAEFLSGECGGEKAALSETYLTILNSELSRAVLQRARQAGALRGTPAV